MQKKGQITLFTLIGVLLLAGVGFWVYTVNTFETSESTTERVLTGTVDEVREFIQDCAAESSKSALYHAIAHGADVFPFYFEVDDTYKIPYYYYEGNSFMFTEDELNIWFTDSATDEFLACIDDFSSFRDLGMDVVYSYPVISADLGVQNVRYNILFPVTVTKDEQDTDLQEEYTVSFPVRLRRMLNIASTIVQSELNSQLYIHWDYLTDVSRDGFNVTAYTERDSTIIYRIVDQDERFKLGPEFGNFMLQFANKFTVES